MSDFALFQSNLDAYPLLARGKVRDIYAFGEERLLIVTTDRLSAYDVVLPDAVPGKGETLTTLSTYWFDRMRDIVPNHLTGQCPRDALGAFKDADQLARRSMIVKRLEPLPIEAVVRGYLVGSGWRDYCETGSVCGISLPPGLERASELEAPIFTPATKARVGDHDENISFETTCELLGEALAKNVRDVSIAIYQRARAHARARGIVIADTKLEFGLDPAGELYVIDEMLTPDSSRFWPANRYRPGDNPPSYDKQYVRDYLESLGWDKRAPGPKLPQDVLAKTAEKYREALRQLTAAVNGSE